MFFSPCFFFGWPEMALRPSLAKLCTEVSTFVGKKTDQEPSGIATLAGKMGGVIF